ncbi:MAG: hypothetical protein ACLPZM_04045 [Thermoplasmata archaeon]
MDLDVELVGRSVGADIGRVVVLELLIAGLFALIFGFEFGWSLVASEWIAWPTALAVTAVVELTLGFPTHVAWAVGASEAGFELRRFRHPELYPWSSLELADGSHWHPLYGRDWVVTVTRPSDNVALSIGLTPAQHELLRRWLAIAQPT